MIGMEFFKNLRGRLNYRATGPALCHLTKDLHDVITVAFEKRKKNVFHHCSQTKDPTSAAQTRQRRRTRSMFADSGKQ